MTTGNKRLDWIIEKALKADFGGGQILLDGYNQQLFTDISYTITTRTFGDNNHFLMEIYEEDETHKRDTAR